MVRTVFCYTALVVLLGAGRLDASVSISAASHTAYAYDISSGSDADYTVDTTIPIEMDLAASYGGSSAATHLSRSQTLFDYTFEHVRAFPYRSYAYSIGYDTFTVTDATSYTIAGTYAMGGEGLIYLDSSLYDITASSYLFYNYQQSLSTLDEVFTLGLTEGDYVNYLSGSLTGALIPGHTYHYGYYAVVQSHPTEFPPASAEGYSSIAFSSSGVPEPASVVIWSLIGALGIGIVRWRGRKGDAKN